MMMEKLDRLIMFKKYFEPKVFPIENYSYIIKLEYQELLYNTFYDYKWLQNRLIMSLSNVISSQILFKTISQSRFK